MQNPFGFCGRKPDIVGRRPAQHKKGGRKAAFCYCATPSAGKG